VSTATKCLFSHYRIIIPKAEDTRFHKIMLLKSEAEAKSLKPRPKGPEDEARGYEAETD